MAQNMKHETWNNANLSSISILGSKFNHIWAYFGPSDAGVFQNLFMCLSGRPIIFHV